jgi:4-hydroxy-3-polyprenylbenzoate decarboxylase
MLWPKRTRNHRFHRGASRTAPARRTSAAVDLQRSPAPLIQDGDGGRYLNTWGTVVVQTPDRQWTNWSITRIMLTGKNTITGLMLRQQHLGMIHAQWKATRVT